MAQNHLWDAQPISHLSPVTGHTLTVYRTLERGYCNHWLVSAPLELCIAKAWLWLYNLSMLRAWEQLLSAFRELIPEERNKTSIILHIDGKAFSSEIKELSSVCSWGLWNEVKNMGQ